MSHPDFARRSTAPELMDDASCDFETFRGCLVDLERTNRLTLAYRPTLGFLEGLRRDGRLPRGRALRILDAGSGYGDTLRQVARWASRHDVAVALEGVDLSPWSARAAREATPAPLPITWHTADVLRHRPEAPVDLVISSSSPTIWRTRCCCASCTGWRRPPAWAGSSTTWSGTRCPITSSPMPPACCGCTASCSMTGRSPSRGAS
ncbi:methyltransferase domain-containing protein [Pseudoroseomonas wenyumeiae]